MGFTVYLSNMVETKEFELEEKCTIAELKIKAAAQFGVQPSQVTLTKADGTALAAPTYAESQRLHSCGVADDATLLLVIKYVRSPASTLLFPLPSAALTDLI